ncbi:hypothetical protein [Pelagibius sp.]|uniref:hypothetical protein n=1 Tax=Pelagibius sp. TaxID=1931238 RepID=UPI00260F6235|nr:hypothetical protein [Pelagibius sp.]
MNTRLGLFAMIAVGVSALVAVPMGALAQSTSVTLTKSYDEDVDVDYDNTIDVDITKDIDVEKDLNYTGTVVISGNLNVSEAALSLIDNKQIIDDNLVEPRGDDPSITNITVIDGTVLNAAQGNIGLNVAVGDNLLQENAAALSAIGTTSAAGSSDAEIFSIQKTINNDFDESEGDSEVLNQIQLLGDVLGGASGNAGVNVAAGAFNAQKNALALAAVTGTATLSEATAAVLQESTFNDTWHAQTTNDVKLGDQVAAGFVGNIGINLTSGTNNLQQNAMSISSVQ